jgi:hypothetical protein
LHKKPRQEEKDDLPQTQEQEATTQGFAQEAFAGPNFYASPDPIMLPMPSFFLRAH